MVHAFYINAGSILPAKRKTGIGGIYMQFNNHQSIYVQIATLMEEEIASGRWVEEERIPSVRELGMQLEVNPNTVLRSYEMAQEDELIYNKRGLGYFVKQGARAIIIKKRKKIFNETDIPAFANKIIALGMDTSTVFSIISKIIAQHEKK
jgi:GntR family transcriptional regulator